MRPRLVFHTTTVVSAMVFAAGWHGFARIGRVGDCVPLISRVTVAELARVLAYPKFQLSVDDRRELLAEYLPFCEVITITRKCGIVCRDAKDQPFLDLAQSGRAEVLISGDRNLLGSPARHRCWCQSC